MREDVGLLDLMGCGQYDLQGQWKQISHINSGKLQYPTFTNGQFTETETRKRNNGANRLYDSKGPNRYLQNSKHLNTEK